MKIMKQTSFLLFLVSVFTACTNSIDENVKFDFIGTKTSDINDDHSVKYNDIVTLTQCQDAITRSSSHSSSNIECIANEANDTLLYVYKKQGGGWIIYSSDTRVPAIVAQSDSGSFEKLMEIGGAQLWIQSMAEDMAAIKQLPDDQLNFSQEEIENNKAFWKSVSSPDEYVKEMLHATTRGLIMPTGHYELFASRSWSEVYDSISRRTKTNWHQDDPYNSYCPYVSDYSHRADAGCAAIAVAQMLYFLNDNLEVPETAPSEAYCYGNVNGYTWAQTNYTSDVWNYMNTNDGIYAAPLIADVGRRLNTNYTDNGSFSRVQETDWVDSLFIPYGITCTYTSYNVGLLKNSLLNGMPVLLTAHSIETRSNGGGVGHAFIADRYKRNRTVTENTYVWVYDTFPPNTPLPEVPSEIEYTYSSPTISMISMNWGWGPINNFVFGWYSLTGDWITSQYNWNIDRHMFYDFHATNSN